MIQAGDLDQTVRLLKPTTVKDAFGQSTQYVTIADVAAKVDPLRGREFFAAASVQSPVTLRVVIYWRIDVQSNWRLQWMGRTLEVSGAPIDVDARHEVLELMCIEVPV